MKILNIAFLILVSIFVNAQNTVTWIGGTPGHETSWNVAKNWSDCHVPDETTHVIIKSLNSGHQAQPIIKRNENVASIEIQAGAKLTIEEAGKLTIDGEYTYSEGITLRGGSIVNNGEIYLYNLDIVLTDNHLESLQNCGSLYVDNKTFLKSQDIRNITDASLSTEKSQK